MKRITVDWTRCTGCRLCAEACSIVKTGACGVTAARIWPMHFSEKAAYVPVVCTQCTEAWCQSVCPAGAIERGGPRDTVTVRADKCTGCRACTMACPFGAIAYHVPSRVAVKCDECDGAPTCVPLCPTGAIRFEEQAAAPGRVRQAWAEALVTASTEQAR